jgi:hypothetical protein
MPPGVDHIDRPAPLQYNTPMDMTRLAAWVMGVILALATAALAQDVKQPPVAPDRTTPRGTLKVLITAMQQAQADTLRSILLAANPAEQQMVEAMVQTSVSVKKLHDAAIATYGAEQAKVITGTVESTDSLDAATATLENDERSAVVTFPDVDQRPVRLVKQGEQWAVPIAELAKDVAPATIEERLGEIRAFNQAIDAVAEEIAQKKHRTAEEAKQALYNRMMQSAAPQALPATQPTSRPATQPQQ